MPWRLLPITTALAMLLALGGTLPFGGERLRIETANAQPATPTATASSTATVAVTTTVTPTATAVATSTSTQPDLVLTVSANLDPVMAGQVLSFLITVRNAGGVVAGQTALTAQVPPGTTVNSLPSGCAEDTVNHTLRCQVLPLGPEQQASISINLNVTATSGLIFNRFVIDPDNLVLESDEADNIVDRTVTVTPTTPVLTSVVVPTATVVAPLPTQVPPQPTVAPPPPTPVPPAPPVVPAPEPAPVPEGQLWLQVLEPTPAVSFEGEELWIAQPGDWYYVLLEEVDWVFAAWESDPPDAGVWIQVDSRVQLAVY